MLQVVEKDLNLWETGRLRLGFLSSWPQSNMLRRNDPQAGAKSGLSLATAQTSSGHLPHSVRSPGMFVCLKH
jgi:hypothetical protein